MFSNALDQAKEEIRKAGYDYAEGCEFCSDEDSSPEDVLEHWINEVTSECLTEGEQDLCQKYCSTMEFEELVNLFREGLKQYFNEHFAEKENA